MHVVLIALFHTTAHYNLEAYCHIAPHLSTSLQDALSRRIIALNHMEAKHCRTRHSNGIEFKHREAFNYIVQSTPHQALPPDRHLPLPPMPVASWPIFFPCYMYYIPLGR